MTTVVTSINPTITWVDPTTDVNGNPIPAGNPTGYILGVRDIAAAGSAPGTYPNTAQVSGGSTITAIYDTLFPGFPLVYGHTYAIAGKTVDGNPALDSAWSAEFEFQYQPVAQLNPPSGFSVA